MERNQEMSSRARERMATMLPELLGAVRSRRRRRVAVRTGAVAALVALLITMWPADGGIGSGIGSGLPGDPSHQQVAAARPFKCEVVHDVEGVLERFAGATPNHKKWFVGDDELQEFLRGADRPQGIVRISGKVVVSSDALDPFPEL